VAIPVQFRLLDLYRTEGDCYSSGPRQIDEGIQDRWKSEKASTRSRQNTLFGFQFMVQKTAKIKMYETSYNPIMGGNLVYRAG
jgi:hypothetical protein